MFALILINFFYNFRKYLKKDELFFLDIDKDFSLKGIFAL